MYAHKHIGILHYVWLCIAVLHTQNLCWCLCVYIIYIYVIWKLLLSNIIMTFFEINYQLCRYILHIACKCSYRVVAKTADENTLYTCTYTLYTVAEVIAGSFVTLVSACDVVSLCTQLSVCPSSWQTCIPNTWASAKSGLCSPSAAPGELPETSE